jgi:acetyl-CoA carboxylase biotin carboxylase subunit
VRLDSGVYEGWTVPLEYDPMLAKLIVWHDTREHAVERMLRALGEYHIGGIESNLPLFRAILNDKRFRAGDLDTGYLDRLLREGPVTAEAPQELAPLAAQAILAGLRGQGETRKPAGEPSQWLTQGRGDQLR